MPQEKPITSRAGHWVLPNCSPTIYIECSWKLWVVQNLPGYTIKINPLNKTKIRPNASICCLNWIQHRFKIGSNSALKLAPTRVSKLWQRCRSVCASCIYQRSTHSCPGSSNMLPGFPTALLRPRERPKLQTANEEHPQDIWLEIIVISNSESSF